MSRNLIAVLLVGFMTIIAGCGGGPSYLRKDIGPDARGGKKYAIVVADYDTLDPAGNRISSETTQQIVKDAIGKSVDEHFSHSLFSANVVKEADVRVAVDNFRAIPVNWRKVKLIDDTTNLGNLREIFKTNDIDRLLIVSGVSRIKNPNWAAGLTRDAAEMAISAASAMVISSAGAPPLTIAFFTVVDRDGRVLYFDREQFTKRGDIIAADERSDMMKSLFDRYNENMAE